MRRLQSKHARHNAFLLVLLASGLLMLGVALQSTPSAPALDTDTPGSDSSAKPPSYGSSGTSVPLSASSSEPTPALSTPARVEPSSPLPFSAQRLAPAEPDSRPSEVTPLMSLPLDSQELMPDGLPASAVRCTRDGGVYTCGTCRTDGDCPPGRACLPNRETRRFECLDAECEEDVHCFPGFVCRTLGSAGANVPPIRRCVPEGQRQQGEPCDPSPLSPQGTCREGLRCVLGVCGPPCLRDDPGSCPEGEVCGTLRGRPTCYRPCDSSDPGSCGEGWTCASGAKDLSFFGCMPDFAP